MSNEVLIHKNTFSINELISLVNTEQYNKLEEAWLGAIESNNNNLPALFEIVELLMKREEKKRAHDFLMTLTSLYKQKGLHQDVLEILKKMLEYNPKEKGLAKEFAECYSYIYKDRPYAKDLITRTCPETTTDIRNAMKLLERYFYLDQGNYVFHKSWGVGEVLSVDTHSEKIHINFEKKSNHSVAIDIAPNILQKLDNDDLLVMIFARKDALQKMIEEQPVDLIKLTLKYFKGKASVSQLKNRLIAGVIPPDGWGRWWTHTKKLLKKDPYIKLTEGTPTTSFLEFRNSPMTHHQEILERLNQTEDLDKKIEITKKYISEMRHTEVCKETLTQLSDEFKKAADLCHETNPSVALECLILLEEMQCMLKAEPDKYKNTIETLIRKNNNLPALVDAVGILEYKKYSLDLIKKIRQEKWQEDFAHLLFINRGNLWEFIIKELIAENKQHTIEEVAFKAFNHFNAYPEHYIWFCKNSMHGRYPELYKNIDPAIMLNRLIELLDNLCFKIQKGRDGDFKTIVNKIKNLLEDKGTDYAINILNDANAESIYNVVSSSKGLEDWFKVSIESVIQDRYPELFEKPGLPKLDEHKIYVTKEGYEKKKKEFDHLMNVEFPENARDLGEAISRGDLRENAEYKAAREKQAMLVEKAERMKSELQRVVILDPHSVHPDSASPGTRVTLRHQGKTELEIYTILGPWDVDIENGVISYLSPIGKGLLNKNAGETVTIKLPEGESSYEIIKIEKAL
ncbi:Transcription elongation factor GreA [Candidatus Brocadiaceae bacterium B188]|nr:transcription elongation factor GreA [Candidatus Brocadia sapporoensis]QQR67918.1 MAG: transcription elongation factor GreA [Candidatus Brocadia sp.]RZV58024.1 MAG: transcription elongation factor GreA [Candidatus Brocadia sp. BROELEC01]TWU52775.1 Transcription elongation factor GreA [Candidatus Brocadiaceae bacterium B188]